MLDDVIAYMHYFVTAAKQKKPTEKLRPFNHKTLSIIPFMVLQKATLTLNQHN